ncbi:hypothetical protein L484_001055 [Morus notabilis]|uniref:Uncharacterized protein n=1 Tax=Morus notabilis TaxID=981085 RepID=W9RBG1_9ROSA|nr:hypothetical protein L484_001055 [Morus notabilis]
MRSLGNLKQLRKLGIKQLEAEHGAALCSAIEKQSYLRDLFMETREEAKILEEYIITSSMPSTVVYVWTSGDASTMGA